MKPSDLACPAILPGIVWGSSFFVLFSSTKAAAKLRRSFNATTKQELVTSSQMWTLQSLGTFSAVLGLVLLWAWTRFSEPMHILHPHGWAIGAFDGGILGLALIGLAIVSRMFFFQAQKFTLVMLIGAGSSLPTCAGTLILIVFTEEFWRALCLRDLIASGLSGPWALLAVSIAYGLTYLAWGSTTAISAFVLGAALGSLFLWTNSFYVAFAAHLVFLGQVLIYVLLAAPDAGPADVHRKQFVKCPACRATLTIEQIDLNPDEAFFCVHCNSRLTVADWRRGFFRWGYVFYVIALEIASMSIVDKRVSGSTLQFVIEFVITLSAIVGLWSFLKVLFPVRVLLETGDPQFIALNLSRKSANRKARDDDGNLSPPPTSS